MKKTWLLGLIGLMSYGGYSLGNAQEQQEPEKHQVFYAPKVTNTLISIYDKKTKGFPLCSLGYRKGNSYFIEDLKAPTIISYADPTTFYNREDCTNLSNYIGMIHNHTGDTISCQPGHIDLRRFINDEKAQIEIIVCNADSDSTQTNIRAWYKELLPQSLINLFKQGSR